MGLVFRVCVSADHKYKNLALFHYQSVMTQMAVVEMQARARRIVPLRTPECWSVVEERADALVNSVMNWFYQVSLECYWVWVFQIGQLEHGALCTDAMLYYLPVPRFICVRR